MRGVTFPYARAYRLAAWFDRALGSIWTAAGILSFAMPAPDYELIAQKVSSIDHRLAELEARVTETETVNARLEQAALTTSRALQEISTDWDAVYEAMRREEAAN